MVQCSRFAFITVQAGNEHSMSVVVVASAISVAMTVAVTIVTVNALLVRHVKACYTTVTKTTAGRKVSFYILYKAQVLAT